MLRPRNHTAPRSLALVAKSEVGKALRGFRRAVDHGQPVIGADRQFIREIDPLLAGILRLGRHDIGAIGQEDVGAAFRHVPAIGAAAGRRRGAGAAAGELQRLARERRRRARADGAGLAEDFDSIVAGGVRQRRRGAELDGRIEHAVEQRRRSSHSSPGRASAHSVLRAKQTTGPALAGIVQGLRMRRVGGGENVRFARRRRSRP